LYTKPLPDATSCSRTITGTLHFLCRMLCRKLVRARAQSSRRSSRQSFRQSFRQRGDHEEENEDEQEDEEEEGGGGAAATRGSTIAGKGITLRSMATDAESAFDLLWKEYRSAFNEFDDLTLARWMAQTLGQVEGKAWRFSHPLLTLYRLAAQAAHERQIWLKRLANPPPSYSDSPCCRAPLLPCLTRDVLETGLMCQHCGDIAVPFEDIPAVMQAELRKWADEYAPVHGVAHWDDQQRKKAGNYDRALESAAKQAETLLARAGNELAPKLLEFYPAVVWEDGDECLEVRPEDVVL